MIIGGHRLLYGIFFLSGMSGLIYESVWTHYLRLFLGSAAYAQALVLGLFMGGLALGAWLSTRLLGRLRNLLLAYAAVELVIGVAGVFFHALFTGFQAFSYTVAIPAIGHPLGVGLYKWAGAGLLIFPQCVLLGMSFPLMSNGMLRQFSVGPGRGISLLYFSNSIGAAVGVLLSGFVLIGWVGLPGTILTAACINILVALLTWWTVRRMALRAPAPWRVPVLPGAGRRLPLLVCGVAFFTGLASFVYEIAWIRMLSLVLGASTHAFELMLSAFITGLALGGLLIARYADRIADPLRVTAWVQVLMALCAVCTLPLYHYSFDWMVYLMRALSRTDPGYSLYLLSSHATVLAVMLPTTLCAGMTLPLLTLCLARQRGYGERSVGVIYAVNTLGSLLGVYLAVFHLLPGVGLGWALFCGAVVDLLLGLLLFLHGGVGRRRLVAPVALGCGVLALGLSHAELDRLRMSAEVFYGEAVSGKEDMVLLYHRDGPSATVQVGQEGQGAEVHRFIQTNGKSDASLWMGATVREGDDLETMLLSGLLPLLLHPQAETVANIGFGSGLTTHTVLAASRRVRRLDSVEIEPGMYEGARHFMPHNRLAYEDPRSHIHFEDARIFFADHGGRYDIIISEPSNPWSNGTASLFTAEFYARVKAHLAADGVLLQWINLYHFDPALLALVVNALRQHFPELQCYLSQGADLLIAASQQPLPLPGTVASGLFVAPSAALQVLLERSDIRSEAEIWRRFVGDGELLLPWLLDHSRQANSDFFPLLDLGALRARYLEQSLRTLSEFRYAWLPLVDWWYAGRTPLAGQRRLVVPRDDASGPPQMSAAVREAGHMVAYLLGEVPLSALEDEALRDAAWLSVLRMGLQARDCGQWPARHVDTFRPAMRYLLDTLLYWVPVQRGRELLRVLRDSCMAAALGPAWLDWYAALVEGDSDAIARTADLLMEQQWPTRLENRAVFESRLLAAVAQRRFAEAVALMEAHQQRLYGEGRLPAWLEIPMALALSEARNADARQLGQGGVSTQSGTAQ